MPAPICTATLGRTDRLGTVLAACLSAQLLALPLPVLAQLRTARLNALATQPAERLQSPTSTCAEST